MMTFQNMIQTLLSYWASKGCALHQGYDLEVGAGTFNPTTFLRCLGPEPYSAVYVEPSRRPQDGRYGENPNRVQFYHQMQVILKPSPDNLQELYLGSLEKIGLSPKEHDIRFVHDDWENPTIGASGLGWEVWADGMEVTQFTYFQTVGGLPVHPVSGEITYGLERLAMFVQKVDSLFDLRWNDDLSYGDVFKRNEWEWSHYNFSKATVELWKRHFEDFEKEAFELVNANLPIPAYDFVMKASHAFNILDARGAISVTERTGYIGRIRQLAKAVAKGYVKSREEQQFPLLRLAPPKDKKETSCAKSAPFDPHKTHPFLLEIGSEELPATFIPKALASFEKEIRTLFKTKGLVHKELQFFATPRRLAVLVHDLAEGSATVQSEKKGPPVKAAFDADGKLTPVGAGFFRSLALAPLSLQEVKEGKASSLSIKNLKGNDYLYAMVTSLGESTKEILAKELPKLIFRIDFPKKMRWGVLEVEYARPLRWVVALLGKEVIPFIVASVTSGRATKGHPTLGAASFTLQHAQDYVEQCRLHKVLVDVKERRACIEEQLAQIEQQKNGVVVAKERVMPHVLHLTEWPKLGVASFDPKFLKAPSEVLISEMVEHQKYFPLSTPEGKLLPVFVVTCNTNPTDLIVHGNQNALSPRLADGVFLYEEDLKTPLKTFNERLKTTIYQKQLGSVLRKVQRIRAFSVLLHSHLPLEELDIVEKGALFCKADLASLLVGEFPELQGTAGAYYADAAKLDKRIGRAIQEHWMPLADKAPLPKSGAGILVSLADKIDNFLSCFSLGLIPTSSSDPYALRRQAIGFIKIILQENLSLPLTDVFAAAFEIFSQNEALSEGLKQQLKSERPSILSKINAFFVARLKGVLQERGFAKDEIEAAVGHGVENIANTYALIQALHAKRQDLAPLIEIHTRARKILPKSFVGTVDPSLLKEAQEKNLFESMQEVQKAMNKTSSYEEALSVVSRLQPPLNAFFDDVKVNCKDPSLKENRLALLKEVLALTDHLADFSKIQMV